MYVLVPESCYCRLRLLDGCLHSGSETGASLHEIDSRHALQITDNYYFLRTGHLLGELRLIFGSVGNVGVTAISQGARPVVLASGKFSQWGLRWSTWTKGDW